jgi:ppGpp synthetase/RelA/SpoT-type nucleotidyltranferase
MTPGILDANREDPERYHALSKLYEARRPLLEEAVRLGKLALAEIQKAHERGALLRISHFSGRVKGLYSLSRKAMSKGIPAERALDELGDVVGLRVVVANLKDVALLIEALDASPAISVLKKEEHGDSDGYRAIHLDIVCRWSNTHGPHEIKGELQVRTLMQDAWAIISHHDFYKNTASLPELAQPISKHLSSLLASADHLADDLRREMESRVTAPSDLSDKDPLTADGIALLYYQTFGEKPPQYEVDFLLKKAKELGVSTIGDARVGLSKGVVNKLSKIHKSRFWTRMGESEAFEFGLLFAAKGAQALKDYKRRVERNWAEVEALARNEALAEMPETYTELTEMLQRGTVPWGAFKVLGAVKDCLRCGSEYLDADAAVEAISEYYGEEDVWDELHPVLAEAENPESPDHAGCCSYCGWQMSKDD